MKFALLEMKITLAKILKSFDVLPGKNFTEDLVLSEGVTRKPKYGIDVIFKKREI